MNLFKKYFTNAFFLAERYNIRMETNSNSTGLHWTFQEAWIMHQIMKIIMYQKWKVSIIPIIVH